MIGSLKNKISLIVKFSSKDQVLAVWKY